MQAAQRRVGRERAVGDRGVDDDEALRDDAPAADVDVADLAVAHHAGRQADGFAAGFERGVRIAFEHALPVRQFGVRDRVAVRVGAQAPAVEDREHERWAAAHRTVTARAFAIRSANEARSRLAPPTSAPSMCGCATNAPMLSGFTLPP